MAIKVLSSVGVPAICTQIGIVKRSAQLLSNALNQAVTEIEGALNDFPVSTSISISSDGWQENTDTDTVIVSTTYYYDINNVDIDQYDLPIITIAPTSLAVAAACGLCSTCESLPGKIRIYSKNAPVSNIIASYFIVKGKQIEENPEYDLTYNNSNEEGES